MTGADPAAAMLAVARAKPHGDRIEWVLATAEAFRSERRFDLVVMTGHAFQVLLTDEAMARALGVVREHLAEGGRFVFESRNPAVDWMARWRQAVTARTVDGAAVTETLRALSREGEFVTFEQIYAFPDETLVSRSTLRFAPREAIEEALAAAGLRAEAVLGDWDGAPFAGAEEEMIFVVRPQQT